jgi:murein tripeptide amidase MpaA
MIKNFFLIVFFLFFSLNVFSQNYKVVKIYLNDKNDVQTLINSGMEFDHLNINKDNSIEVFLSENDFSILQISRFNYEILIDDWNTYFANLPGMTETEKTSALQRVENDYGITGFNYGSMGGFYTLAEVNAELDEMYALFPNLITQKVSIGNTIEGRPMYMVKISDNPNVSENEPQVLYTALIHAREPESMEQMIFFMFYLLENYGTDPEATYLVNNRELYFVPVINADGYQYNYQTYPGGGGMWRKNRRNNGGSYGVDLNRNYGPYSYWNSSNGGSSTSPSSDTYRGTAPFSEPETANIKDFIATKYLKCALNYHTYGNYLIYPYAALDMETPDSSIFREFSLDMTSYNGYTHGLTIETVGYSVRGSSDDYFYDGDVIANHGKIIAMTPEVGTTGFWPSQSEIIPLAEENLRPNLYYAWAAGEFVNLVNASFSQQYFNPGDYVEISIPQIRNKGLSIASNISLALASDNSEITINNGNIIIGNVPARTSVNNSQVLSFTLGPGLTADIEVKMAVTISTNGTPMYADTLSFIVGTPVVVFSDTTNDPTQLWNITSTPANPHWESTTTSYHSAPNSYTDSKTGNYANNATVTMTSKDPINLSTYQHPRLGFWTRYNIETNWDYGQVKISTNNGSTWNPLAGNYTEPGVGSFQPNGEPLYDGIQSSWVKEEMDLTGRNAIQNKIQFQLRTDGNTVADGWYVDDINVFIFGIVPVELSSFTAKVIGNSVNLDWITSSELNNMGFEIERKSLSENTGWQKIGFVEGSGNSTTTKNYTFRDENPLKGTSLYRLRQIDFDGSFRIYNSMSISFEGVNKYVLEQNYPNPFNPSTTINYSIPSAGKVKLTVYNLLGSEVAVLVDEFKEPGNYSVEFSTENLKNRIGSGVYVYSLKSGLFTQTKKMVVLK